ncbi:MAG TPA: hypothetical protein VMU30_05255 [Bacteroidota bacterium]|nr:hypothetical protein [Bacteroidota bacterium]
MSIQEISGSGTIVPQSKSKKIRDEKKASDVKQTDRAEVSDEARSKYLADQTKRLDEVKQRMDDGFYNRRDVLERVVDSLLKDVTQ